MKKLLASGCCIFFLHSFSQLTVGNDAIEDQASGKRSLLRAMAAIVNSEAYRKSPQKQLYYPRQECPRD